MHRKVDPAALLIAILTLGFTPLTTAGPWDKMNTIQATVVLAVLLGFTWPRKESFQDGNGQKDPWIIAAQALVYGFVIAIGIAWPIQEIFYDTIDCKLLPSGKRNSCLEDNNKLADHATNWALVVGMAAAIVLGVVIWVIITKLIQQDRVKTPPRETVSAAVEEANAAVAAEVLDRVRGQEPAFLEHLVLDVLTAMGYGGPAGAAEHLERSGDQGLDGVIRQDALGLDRIYFQVKLYGAEQSVGWPEIQAFVEALQGTQAGRGIFITTSRFTADAISYVERVPARVVLIDGPMLADLMVRHNIGVRDQETYVIKRIDEDFFEDTP